MNSQSILCTTCFALEVMLGEASWRGFAQGRERQAGPSTICYPTQPQPYFNDHAADIRKIYDGFFFNVGSWEKTAQRFVGVGGAAPENQASLDAARANLAALRKAGVTENFLTVYFADSAEWPATPRR